MVREISAGGVVVRLIDGEWWMAAIEPAGDSSASAKPAKRSAAPKNKPMYVRTWGDGERVFKIVSFYLLRYESGEIDHISEAMRIEVARAAWVKLKDAPKLLAYKGEKQMAGKALQYVIENTNL